MAISSHDLPDPMPLILPKTIGEVIDRLDVVIDRARRDDDRAGYFAVLYRNVTRCVRDGIAEGRFEDGARMERLDVLFANRYLEAYEAFRAGNPLTQSWRVAFEAASRWETLLLQHLLLGMNAHINLDLGIAAARTCPGPAIVDLERDFREINAILIGMLHDVQECLSSISPWFGLLDAAGGEVDELIAKTGLTGTRDWAWMNALHLAALNEDRQGPVIERIDRSIAEVGMVMNHPGLWFATVAFVVRIAERGSVGEIMDALDMTPE